MLRNFFREFEGGLPRKSASANSSECCDRCHLKAVKKTPSPNTFTMVSSVYRNQRIARSTPVPWPRAAMRISRCFPSLTLPRNARRNESNKVWSPAATTSGLNCSTCSFLSFTDANHRYNHVSTEGRPQRLAPFLLPLRDRTACRVVVLRPARYSRAWRHQQKSMRKSRPRCERASSESRTIAVVSTVPNRQSDHQRRLQPEPSKQPGDLREPNVSKA